MTTSQSHGRPRCGLGPWCGPGVRERAPRAGARWAWSLALLILLSQTLDEVGIVRAEEDGEPPLPVRVQLKSGEILEGNLLTYTSERIRMRIEVGVGSVERTIPAAEIDHILFGEEPGEEALLENPDYPVDAEAVWELYLRKQRFLEVPRSNAGRVALTYAGLVLGELRRLNGAQGETGPEAPDDEAGPDRPEIPLAVYERALRLCRTVEEGDWSAERRAEGQLLRLRLMLNHGEIEEVIAEARQLARNTRSLDVHLEAGLLVAEGTFISLTGFVKENPRWSEDDVAKPGRDRLFHKALDAFLYPSLFYPTREEAAAEGLLGAAQVYQHAGEEQHAVACAIDLLALYPDSELIAEARDLLAILGGEPEAGEAPDQIAEDEGVDEMEEEAEAIDDPLLRSMNEQLQRRRVEPMEPDAPSRQSTEGEDGLRRFDDEEF